MTKARGDRKPSRLERFDPSAKNKTIHRIRWVRSSRAVWETRSERRLYAGTTADGTKARWTSGRLGRVDVASWQ
jgi:hypothetical protein